MKDIAKEALEAFNRASRVYSDLLTKRQVGEATQHEVNAAHRALQEAKEALEEAEKESK